jgi:hypothetical protein
LALFVPIVLADFLTESVREVGPVFRSDGLAPEICIPIAKGSLSRSQGFLGANFGFLLLFITFGEFY